MPPDWLTRALFPSASIGSPASIWLALSAGPATYLSEATKQAEDTARRKTHGRTRYAWRTCWPRLATPSFRQPPVDPRSASVFINNHPPFYKIDWQEKRLTLRGPQSDDDWDEIIAVMNEYQIVRSRSWTGAILRAARAGAWRRLKHLANLVSSAVRISTADEAH